MGRRRNDPAVVGAIALGGALGAPARYGVAHLIRGGAGTFPWATFWTNITGSFALGVILVVLVARFPPATFVRPFVAVGLLGAFTTYSTFAMETVLLSKDGDVALACASVVASLVVGVGAALAGMVLGRRIPTR